MTGKRRKYTVEDWEAVRARLAMGDTVRGAAAACGVGRGAVFAWGRSGRPPGRMGRAVPTKEALAAPAAPRTPRQRLGWEDRCRIEALAASGARPGEIAARVGVHRTTVSRELARLGGPYDAAAAQRDAEARARRPKPRRLDDPELRAAVARGLARRWSPRQVSERLRAEHPGEGSTGVSHETIYQAPCVQGRGSLRQEFAVEAALRRGGSRRRPRSRMPARPRGKSWVEGCEISLGPPESGDRAAPGHWEGDLVVGSDGRACLVTLVERRTRFLVARRLDEHTTGTVVDLLVGMVGALPGAVRDGLLSTLTWDQGCEMADAARFTRATGFKVYFCDPHSPWQKGTNENTNGLIRQYFPKGTDFSEVGDDEVRAMQDELNGRPRQTLGWLTPAEAIQSELEKANRAMTG